MPRLASLRQVLVDIHQLGERALDLVLVIAENRARLMGAFLLASRTSVAASLPISSPSRSKSVAITNCVGFLREVLQRADQLALGRLLADRRPH